MRTKILANSLGLILACSFLLIACDSNQAASIPVAEEVTEEVVEDLREATAIAVTNPNTGEVSDALVEQDGSLAVFEEHIRVLNECDWVGLMAQYPDDAEIHLSGGAVVKGRQAIGDLFAGFVSPPEDGGLCGLTFVAESIFEVGGTQNVQWVADADFLAEPYRGSDAYVSDGRYMTAMVTTFEGTDLMMLQTADSVTNPNTGEVSDTLVPQAGSVAVFEEHIRVLNDCDWVGLMAQYPNDSEIHLSDGTVIKGRQAIGDLFAGFVLPPEEGGLCGLTFVEQSRFEAGGTQNVHWEASADFLAEPYNGSDAYVSNGLYMDAMVTTFEGTDLMMLQAADSVTNPNTGEVSDTLVPQAGSVAVFEEHIRVLNDCDWVGLMAQYPNDSEIHLSDGTVIKGRQAIGDLFAGFVLPPEEGGLCGLTFVEQSRFEAGGTQNVHWEASADFLAEPYNGSDAYVSNGLYMDAMVTTFEGTDLMILQAADSVTNPNTGEVSDMLVPQAGSVAVYEEHIRTLNACDWIGLMAQYPNDSEIHLSDGTVIKGRQAIGDLFAGFVLPPEEGGLCGLTFVEESRFEAGGSQNVQWVADADFLAEPYRGSDAYVSNGLYMDAMVTTFRGSDLKMDQ